MAKWNLTLNLAEFWHNENLGFIERRDKIVAAIKASRWKSITADLDELESATDELAETLNIREFDLAFADLYDQADIDRVWIETY